MKCSLNDDKFKNPFKTIWGERTNNFSLSSIAHYTTWDKSTKNEKLHFSENHEMNDGGKIGEFKKKKRKIKCNVTQLNFNQTVNENGLAIQNDRWN